MSMFFRSRFRVPFHGHWLRSCQLEGTIYGFYSPWTDPNGAAIYGVPWIPSIYPLYVSINIPAPWILWVVASGSSLQHFDSRSLGLIQLFDEKRQRHGFCWDSEDRRSMEVGDAGNVIQKQEFPYHNEGLWIQPPKEVWPRLAKYLGLFEHVFFSQFQMIILIFPLNNFHFFPPFPLSGPYDGSQGMSWTLGA